MALTSSSYVFKWGDTVYGQIGVGNPTKRSFCVPYLVEGLREQNVGH